MKRHLKTRPEVLRRESKSDPDIKTRSDPLSSGLDSDPLIGSRRIQLVRHCRPIDSTPGSPLAEASESLERDSEFGMGLIKSSVHFLLGAGCGIYIAQNYNVPNIKKLVNTWMFVAKHIEETYRKPRKDED
ncbi:hypothetical protein J5N97_006071 [Dioscorea zingiberensis]|uniref:Uncharacterized protein n=1 Tax=Dioscorea zingiberensis TaxID=325984 RepID=A0A9D5DBL1_9LILI|nr:hypothetical protein J5N97_006071 [Dioscorea zingiberensis]